MTNALFALEQSPVAVSPELKQLFARIWGHIAAPGTWWTGPERVTIAGLARANRSGDSDRGSALPAAANDAVALLAASCDQKRSRGWFMRRVMLGVPIGGLSRLGPGLVLDVGRRVVQGLGRWRYASAGGCGGGG